MFEQSEKRWLFFTSIVILGITAIPYLMGYFLQGPYWRFTGFVFGVEDGNSYIAKMLTGTYGSWLFRSPYSTIPQSGILAFFPYILLGKLAYPPNLHDQLVVLFQFFRWIAGGFLIWSTYGFISLFIKNPFHRKLAVLIILVGGGLGWLGWLFLPDDGSWRLPLEVYSPEAFVFLSIIGLPHLAAARGFLLLGFTWFLRQEEDAARFSSAVKAGLCWLSAGFFQPLTIVVGCGVLFLYLIFVRLFPRSNRAKTISLLEFRAAIMAAIASPWILYNFFFFSSDVFLRKWYAQNIISSPPITDYLWSYGIYIVAGIPAIIHILREKDTKRMILPAWIVCAAVLAYFPYNLQRRFIDGIWIAIVILLYLAIETASDRKRNLIDRAITVTTFIAPVFVMMTLSQGVTNVQTPVYRPRAEVDMFEALSNMVTPGDTVLCAYQTANALPAWAPVYVLAGHGPESANLESVVREIEMFYSNDQEDQWKSEFLLRNSVDFVIYGPEERAFNTLTFIEGKNLVSVYTNQDFQVFQVDYDEE